MLRHQPTCRHRAFCNALGRSSVAVRGRSNRQPSATCAFGVARAGSRCSADNGFFCVIGSSSTIPTLVCCFCILLFQTVGAPAAQKAASGLRPSSGAEKEPMDLCGLAVTAAHFQFSIGLPLHLLRRLPSGPKRVFMHCITDPWGFVALRALSTHSTKSARPVRISAGYSVMWCLPLVTENLRRNKQSQNARTKRANWYLSHPSQSPTPTPALPPFQSKNRKPSASDQNNDRPHRTS